MISVSTNHDGIDTIAVALAAEHLGLQMPVHITSSWLQTMTLGKYIGVDDGAHQIVVYSDHRLSDTLWHELTHALQCERDWRGDHLAFIKHVQAQYDASGLDFSRALGAEDAERYFSIPVEAEARENESLAGEFSLTKPTQEPIESLISAALMEQIEDRIADEFIFGQRVRMDYKVYGSFTGRSDIYPVIRSEH